MNGPKIPRFILVCCFVLVCAPAWAQGSSGTIAGVVKDASGAVLPGVTVEAASAALIEKTRTSVTDGQGQYKIVDLRPGVYAVTFTLPGFSGVKREGLELTTSFTATVNAELKVGTVEETITVSGETPVVDIQNVRQQTTLAKATLDAIPSTGRLASYATLIPGAVLGTAVNNSVGGLDERAQFGVHGQRSNDNAPIQDGMVQRLQGGAVFVFNNLTFQEVVVETSGMSAERNTGGVQMNMVPKDGGNTFSGTFRTVLTGPRLQADNMNDVLRARGLLSTPSVKQSWEAGGTLGGPIKQNTLWFFSAFRRAVNQQYQQGNYYNKLTTPVGTDPTYRVLLYEPDLSRPAFTDDYYKDLSVRLTWQATTKQKFVGAYQIQPNCSCFWPLLEPTSGGAGGILAAPEAVGRHDYVVNYMPIVTWTYPVTNRLLLEAGASANMFNNNTKRQEGVGLNTIQITELALNYRYAARATGLTHAGGYRVQHNRQYHQRFAASYITGTHAWKTGIELNEHGEGLPGRASDANQINGARDYTFRNGVPQSVRIWAVPFEAQQNARDLGIFVQDQWTMRKLTLNLGLRYSNFNGSIPEQHMPAGPFVPARDFPSVKNVPNWSSVSPRLGVAYDVFGNGKTALKVALGRYTPYSRAAEVVNNPASNQAASTSRNWTDTNGNYVPDCDLRNPAINGECGIWSDLSFGQARGSNTRRAPDALSGFNKQDYNWQTSVSVQQELRPNVALNVGYFRTSYRGFIATDNLATKAADYDSFCVTVPVDSRLPNSGKQLCGFYDIKPALFGAIDNLVTQGSNYGKQSEIFNGVDVTLNTRFGEGGQFSGGLSMGRIVTDNCYQNDMPQVTAQATGASATSTAAITTVTPRLPEFCHVTRPWSAATQVKFLFVYPLPWDFQTSATYQDIAGIPIAASYAASNAEIVPSLGRNLASCRGAATCNANVSVDLIPNNTLFEDRLHQLDFRIARLFRMARVRLRGNFDIYNVFNSSDVLNETNRYSLPNGGQWLQPVQILGGRLLKFSVQFDF